MNAAERTGSERDLVRRVARLFWPNLPVLLTGSVLVALGWVAVRAGSGWSPWLSIAGAGLVVVPLFAVLLRGCEVLLSDEHFGVVQLFRSLPRSVLRAVRVAVVPTVATSLTFVAVLAWQLSGSPVMLASVAVGTVLSVVAAYVGIIALPYVVRTGAGWREAWPAALYVASRNPVLVLGIGAATALTVWAAAYLSFALVLLLPAPLALLWAGAETAAVDRSRRRLSGHLARS
jgi:hypothetical protein